MSVWRSQIHTTQTRWILIKLGNEEKHGRGWLQRDERVNIINKPSINKIKEHEMKKHISFTPSSGDCSTFALTGQRLSRDADNVLIANRLSVWDYVKWNEKCVRFGKRFLTQERERDEINVSQPEIIKMKRSVENYMLSQWTDFFFSALLVSLFIISSLI